MPLRRSVTRLFNRKPYSDGLQPNSNGVLPTTVATASNLGETLRFHNPASALALCLWSQQYVLASELTGRFAAFEPTLDFLPRRCTERGGL